MKSEETGLVCRARALHLRQMDEGTTLATNKDEVRRARARELLMQGPRGMTVIALTLEDTRGSSLVHAFRRWTGRPPGQCIKFR